MSNVTRFGPSPLLDNEVANKAYVDAGGGGASGQTFARVVKKITETVVSSTTLQDDDELFVALEASKTYGFILYMPHISPAAADIKYAFSVPAGAVGRRNQGVWDSNVSRTDVGIGTSNSVNTGGTDSTMIIYGHLIMDTTVGNLQFQWAQNISNAGNTQVMQGAFLVVWEELP